jgi:hypothetical protein
MLHAKQASKRKRHSKAVTVLGARSAGALAAAAVSGAAPVAAAAAVTTMAIVIRRAVATTARTSRLRLHAQCSTMIDSAGPARG